MRILALAVLIGCGGSTQPPRGSDVDANTSAGDANAADARDSDANPQGAEKRIEIYSGDGTMTMGGWPSGDPLKAIVLQDGVPVPGVMVHWQTTHGDMALTGEFQTGMMGTAVTDASGIARVGLRGDFLSQMTSAVSSTVRASIVEGSVDFATWSTYWTQQVPAPPSTYITVPDSRDLGTQAPGTVVMAGVKVVVAFNAGTEAGRGMPGVGVRFTAGNDAAADLVPPVSCANAIETHAGGTVFTDATGTATCDVRVPTVPGLYQFGIYVGGTSLHSPFSVRVE